MYNKKIDFETLISLSQKVLIYWYWYFQYFLNFKNIEVLANQYFFGSIQRVRRVKEKGLTGQAGQEEIFHGSDGSKNF